MIPGESDTLSTASIGRGARAGLLACGMFTTIGLFGPGLILPQIARAFAAVPHSAILTQLVGAISSFTFAVSAWRAGMLVARLGCRKVIAPSLIAFAAVGVAPAALDDLWLIVTTRAGLGVALAGIFTGALAGIGGLPDLQRSRMFGFLSVVGGAVAILVFPAVSALGLYGWRPAFAINIVALLVLPLAFRIPGSLGRTAHAAERSSDGSERLITPAMIGLLLIAGLVGMSMFIAPMYAPLYLAAQGVTNPALLAVPVTMSSVAAVIASAAYGPLQRRLGLQGVFATALLGVGAALSAAAYADGLILFTLTMIVHATMLSVMAPNVSASALACSSASKGAQAMGLATGVMFGAQLLFPLIAASLQAYAGLRAVFIGFAAACALAGLLVLARSGAVTRRMPGGASLAQP